MIITIYKQNDDDLTLDERTADELTASPSIYATNKEIQQGTYQNSTNSNRIHFSFSTPVPREWRFTQQCHVLLFIHNVVQHVKWSLCSSVWSVGQPRSLDFSVTQPIEHILCYGRHWHCGYKAKVKKEEKGWLYQSNSFSLSIMLQSTKTPSPSSFTNRKAVPTPPQHKKFIQTFLKPHNKCNKS